MMKRLQKLITNKKFSMITLGLIVLLAAVLRLWSLGAVPPSPDWDEVALGYNAYSILYTGRDEYGKLMPVVLQSFNDYKPAFYTYTTIPFIAIFGLTTFAVRLPSALVGIGAILITYFLVKELFTVRGATKNSKQSSVEILALIAAFLLAISPWHIQFSRAAFEANMGLTTNLLAMLFFLKGLKKPWLLSVAAICMAGNFYIYQSDRVFTPLLGIALFIIYRKELFSLPKKYLVSAFLIGVLVLSPLFYYIATNANALSRAKGVSVFSQQTMLLESSQKKLEEDKANHNFLGEVLHNRRVIYTRESIGGYLSHYDLNWLFLTGDSERHHAPHMGLLYLWELPFLLIGIYALLFFPFPTKTKLLIFSWFLITPLPAAITFDVPHAVRTLNFLPTFQIFIALGLIQTFLFLKNYRLKILVCSLFFIILFCNFAYYFNQYFVQQNYYYSREWQYGYEDAVKFVKQIEGKYDTIMIARDTPLDQSYIFFLFYLQYPPQEYQQQINNRSDNSGNFDDAHDFGKYKFRRFKWEKDRKSNVLYVGRPGDFPKTMGEERLKTINYLDGKPAIMIVEGR